MYKLKRLLKATILPLLVFIFLLLAKYILVFRTTYGPFLLGDEFIYAKMAKGIFDGVGYADSQYPLFYPLFLSISYFFKDNFYEASKCISIILSSLIVFPAYGICRLYLNEKKSLICTIACAVIPFSFVLSRTMMSEVLYFPLILTAIFLVLKEFRTKVYFWDGLLGAVLGMMFMTRYITIVIIPVFVILWWVKPTNGITKIIDFSLRKFLRFFSFITCAILAFTPWVIMMRSHGESWKHIIGLGIAENTNAVQLTLKNLISWTAIYGFYYILLLLPVFSFLFFVLFRFDKARGKFFSLYNRLIILVVLLSGAFGVAVIRHSWLAFYNVAVKQRVMGRYLIYFAALFIIAAVVTYELVDKDKVRRFLNNHIKKFIFLIIGNALFLGLAALSIAVLFFHYKFKVSPGIIAMTSSIDLAVMKSNLIIYFAVVVITNIIAAVTVLYGRKHLASVIVCIGVITSLVVSYPVYNSVTFQGIEPRTFLADLVAKEIKKEADPSQITSVILTKGVVQLGDYDRKGVYTNIYYKLMNTKITPPEVVNSDKDFGYEMLGRKGYVILNEGEETTPEMKYKFRFTFRFGDYKLYKFDNSKGLTRFVPGTAYSSELLAGSLPPYVFKVDASNRSFDKFGYLTSKMCRNIAVESEKNNKSPAFIFTSTRNQYFALKVRTVDQSDFGLKIKVNGKVFELPKKGFINNLLIFDVGEGNQEITFINESKKNSIILEEMFIMVSKDIVDGVFSTDLVATSNSK